VTADEIAAHAAGHPAADARRVGLCFDDAWASLWTVAAPLLKRYGLTAITYAIPERMVDGSPFVTWAQLREMHASGVIDVQSHTDSHSMIFYAQTISGFVTPAYVDTPLLNRPQLAPPPSLRFVTAGELGAPLYPARSRMSDARRVPVSLEAHARCVEHVAASGGPAFFERAGWQDELTRIAAAAPPRGTSAESDDEQIKALEAELDRSRAVLNDRLRTRTVNHICLPWGVSSARTADILRRVGYRSAFANRLAGVHAVKAGDDPYWLKRLPNKYIFRLPGRGRRLWG
jgi:hypothetical protein